MAKRLKRTIVKPDQGESHVRCPFCNGSMKRWEYEAHFGENHRFNAKGHTQPIAEPLPRGWRPEPRAIVKKDIPGQILMLRPPRRKR